jgi:hypothetical protein
LWIHPHLLLVSHFMLTFLIWFSSNVGVSATANMYKHATLDYIYFLQPISHLYLLFVGLQVMLIFVHYNNSYLLFVGLQGLHCVIIPSQSSYLIRGVVVLPKFWEVWSGLGGYSAKGRAREA